MLNADNSAKKERKIQYDSKHMIFWKRQNHRGSKKIHGCQGFMGRERGVNGAQGIFRVVKQY